MSEKCGAKKRNGEPCRGQPRANGRCRLHGGNSLIGPASPSYRTGRYSRLLPPKLLERYLVAQRDLVRQRQELGIALVDAQLAVALEGIGSDASGGTWRAVATALDRHLAARDGGDESAVQRTWRGLEAAIRAGANEAAAWADVRALIDQRARLVANERQRQVQLRQVLTADQAMALLAAVVDVIKRHVRDRDALAAISADIRALTSVQERP